MNASVVRRLMRGGEFARLDATNADHDAHAIFMAEEKSETSVGFARPAACGALGVGGGEHRSKIGPRGKFSDFQGSAQSIQHDQPTRIADRGQRIILLSFASAVTHAREHGLRGWA